MANMRIILIGSMLFIGINLAVNIADSSAVQAQNAEVSPVEDLMREHGVLGRILLIYEEIARRLDNNEAFLPETLAGATEIIQNFIQNYHERLEERYLFNRFQNANMLVDLVRVLNQQHEAGRKIINDIAVQERLQSPDDKKNLAGSLRLFIRLYRPHKAREDTILFPALHNIVSLKEYDKLGEEFENEEHRLFGESGFEKIVDRVAGLEKSLGIYELSQFTPANR